MLGFLRNILGSEVSKRSFSVASVNSGAVTHDRVFLDPCLIMHESTFLTEKFKITSG